MNYFQATLDLVYRNITASRRTLPQVYVLGAPKCGTTSLYEIMRQHPNFLPPFFSVKELNYLQDIPDYIPYEFHGILKIVFNTLFGQYDDHKSYRKFFPLQREMKSIREKTRFNAVTGDFSPIYLYCKTAAKRIAEVTPKAKLIIMLRNPIDRAYSEYNMFHERTPFEPRSFEQAIDDEMNGVSIRHYVRETYMRRGIYEPYVKMYFDMFDRNQIMVVRSEAFFSDTTNALKGIFEFLELPWDTFALKDHYKNETQYTVNIKEETRAYLQRYYREHNERLYEYLKMDMGWA